MGTYTQLKDVKVIMRASSRERIRFSGDAFRTLTVGQIQNTAIGSVYNQSKFPEPIYTASVKPKEIRIEPTYYGRDLINFVFIDSTNYNVYFQEFTGGSFDSREMLHGAGSTTTTYNYNDEISFPPEMWVGAPAANQSFKINFECDISEEHAEHFITNAEIAIDNMLSAAAVDYLTIGKQRIFSPPDIPPPIAMAAQYLAAYYIYTNVFAEQNQDPSSGHFTERWKKACMDVLRDFAVWKTRLPPGVSSRINWTGNMEARVLKHIETPVVPCLPFRKRGCCGNKEANHD